MVDGNGGAFMNREIKFRAWQKYWKMMLPVSDLSFSKLEDDQVGLATCGDADCLTCVDYFEYKDVELMQFTGLKDKRCVEIFEGDIVEFLCSNEGLNGLYKVVRANSGEWRIENGVQGRVLYYSLENVKVISNVFENPELLERERE